MDTAKSYIGTAREILERAGDEFARGDTRRAAEKLWGATALRHQGVCVLERVRCWLAMRER